MLRKLATRILARVRGTAPSIHQQYPQYQIGRGTYGNPTVFSYGEGATLEIGAFCSIAEGVTIFLGGEHRADWVTTYPFSVLWTEARGFQGHPRTKGNVVIGHDVWIGYQAVILSGVTIGTGAVIGCRAVVTRDVPDYAIVAGNPASVVRKRFSDSVIEQLVASRWWELDDRSLTALMPHLLNSDIEQFLHRLNRLPRES